MTALWFF